MDVNSQIGISYGRSGARGARRMRLLPVFHASITLDPHQSLTFSVTPQLGWRMLRGGIFELQPQRWEDFSHRKTLSGRHISRCEGPQGRQLGVVLEEHAGGWRGWEDSSVGWSGWKKPDHAGPLFHRKAFRILISTLKTIKEFKQGQRHVMSFDGESFLRLFYGEEDVAASGVY